MRVLSICKLGFKRESRGFSGDARAVYHLTPIALSKRVDRLHSIRYKRFSRPVPKTVEYTHLLWQGRPFLFPLAMLHILLKALWITFHCQVDYVIGFTIPYGALAWLTAKITGRRVGISLIGEDLYKGVREKWYGKIVVFILRRCEHVTVTGEDMKSVLVDRGVQSERVYILPHGIETVSPAVDRTEKNYDMVFVGELVPRKRVDTLLDAFKLLKQAHGNARFCIVGDGPLRPELEAQAKQLGVREAVDFVGFQENVWSYLRQSRVFVLASANEGLPFAMIEAMACALVPVVTDVGTIGDVVRDGDNGYLIQLGDSETLAKRVTDLLDDNRLYTAMSGKAVAVRNDFSYQRAMDTWDDIFGKVKD